jgi:citrate lyase subunit beta/citryl-CoA lyase
MPEPPSPRIAPGLRRSWLFVAGADAAAQDAAIASGADVVIQDLEDFTPPGRRAQARALAAALYAKVRAAGALAAVRVNPLEAGGRDDLAQVVSGRPDIVLLPKTVAAAQVAALDAAVAEAEARHGIPRGATELVPNVETAAGLVETLGIARASPRVTACLVAAEDMAADLGAERRPDGEELLYARSRFLVECRAAGVEAVDCPYTFADAAGAEREARFARRLGYRCKSLVRPDHAQAVNRALTPSAEETEHARRIVRAFEAARARGEDRALVDGAWIEVPGYLTAKRLIARAEEFAKRC